MVISSHEVLTLLTVEIPDPKPQAPDPKAPSANFLRSSSEAAFTSTGEAQGCVSGFGAFGALGFHWV